MPKVDLFSRLAPVFLILTVGLAFAVGVLWQRVSELERGGSGGSPVISGNSGDGSEDSQGKLSSDAAKKIPVVSEEDHIRGSKDADVLLIEYSDLECPFCKRFHPVARQAVDEYGGKVAWVYRQYPLDTLHSKARTESEASECAFEQGGNDGFWKFVDKIFEVTPSNNGLNLADLPKLANQVGLDGTKLKSCIDSGKYKDKVEKQLQGGNTAGVTGTPGNFVVNKKGEAWVIPGAVPFETLKITLEEALKS